MRKYKNNDIWADGGIPKLFVGRYDSKVYYGGRICISAEWRAKLDGDRVVALRDLAEPNAICLMPESLYEKELAAMQDKDYPEEERADEQSRHLVDADLVSRTEKSFGKVLSRIVLYRGADFDHPDGIAYRNVETYLKGLTTSHASTA